MITRRPVTSAFESSHSVSYRLTLILSRVIYYSLKMEAARSSESLVYNKPTLLHVPEDGILQSRIGCYASADILELLLVAWLTIQSLQVFQCFPFAIQYPVRSI
jgi:hypothetical protein